MAHSELWNPLIESSLYKGIFKAKVSLVSHQSVICDNKLHISGCHHEWITVRSASLFSLLKDIAALNRAKIPANENLAFCIF